MDISWLPDVEASGGQFFTSAGKKIDAIKLLKASGVKVGRIRIFVNPRSANGNIDRALALAKRLKVARMQICIDLHYSDDWADPSQQSKPALWSEDIFKLENEVYKYTETTLKRFVNNGLAPQWVQIGNEIGGGFIWPHGKIGDGAADQWRNFTLLHNAGSRALRQVLPNAKSVIHLEWGGDSEKVRWWLSNANKYGLEGIDLIGLSYYSQWNGSLEKLDKTLNVVTNDFNLPVVIAETAYPWISKSFGKDVLDVNKSQLPSFPFSPQGQAKYVQALKNKLRNQPLDRGIGLWWWEGLATAVRSADGSILWNAGMANATLVGAEGKSLPGLSLLGTK